MSTEMTLLQTGLTWDIHDGEPYILAPYKGERTREIAKVFSGVQRGEAEAYARLFAAAPELLDAARRAMEQLRLIALINQHRSIRKGEIDSSESLRALQEAIAKAESS